MTKEEYEKESLILLDIKRCVLRYASYLSQETQKDEHQSEWCRQCVDYLNERENEIKKKTFKSNKIKRILAILRDD